MTVLAHWQRINNFGDNLTPWLVTRITGKPPTYASPADPRPKLIACGSILRDAGPNCVVWGAGALSMREVIRPDADYRAVRGPFSRKMILEQGGNCPEVYGDPGLLVPRWIPRPARTTWKLGVVPHYNDYGWAWDAYGTETGTVIANIRGSVEGVVEVVSMCDVIASSSLHGLVLAVAYGIPHVHVVFGDRLAGDGTKFQDFYEGIGQQYSTLDCQSHMPGVGSLIAAARKVPIPDTAALWEACPILELDNPT